MLGEHGSFRRYVTTAMLNFLAFYILWEFFVFIFPEEDFWPTVAWAIAWFLGSLQAHWTHRIWTFDSDRDVKWTIPTTRYDGTIHHRRYWVNSMLLHRYCSMVV